jgi:lipopolysaccharide transport system ATP-binding protein
MVLMVMAVSSKLANPKAGNSNNGSNNGDQSKKFRQASEPGSKSGSKADAIGESRIGMGGAEILSADIVNSVGEPTQTVKCGERVCVRSTILFHKDVEQPISGFKIKTINGIAVIGNSTFGSQKTLPAIAAGTVLNGRIWLELLFNPW